MSNENMPEMDRSALDDPDKLVSLGREYFSSDFPNPSRIDCPSTNEIEEVIRSGRMPSDDLCQHLFSCSNCFKSYRASLAADRRQAAPVESTRRRMFAQFFQRPLGPVMAILMLGVVIAGVLYFRFPSRLPWLAQKTNESLTDPSHNRTTVETPRSQAPSAKGSLHIELDNYSLPRGSGQTEESPQVVEPAGQPTALSITLPGGSPAGDYVVTIVGPFGDVLARIPAKSSDGRTLTAAVDLGGLPKDKYRVCVARPDESPHCREIVIK